MEPLAHVDEVMSRAARYWMEDGLVEITLGLQMLFLSGGFLAVEAPPAGPLIMAALLFGVPQVCMWGFKRLKERITYPRCGYVEFPKRSTKYLTWFFAGALALLAVAVGLSVFQPSQTDWLSQTAVPAFAALFAICLIGPGLQYKQPSMLWEGFLTLLFAGGLEWFTDFRGFRGLKVLMVMVGISMAISGGFRLRSFLKANPKPQETET